MQNYNENVERFKRIAVADSIPMIMWYIKRHFWKPESVVTVDDSGNTFLDNVKTALKVKQTPCRFFGIKYVLVA